MSDTMNSGKGEEKGRWEHFHHVADIGVRGIGFTREDAFSQAGIALTAVITDPATVDSKKEVIIQCEAPDEEFLFVEWLNGIIYEMAVNHMLFSRFQIHIDGMRLTGSCWGETVDPHKHQPSVEVKGATFTALQVAYDVDSGLWTAQCVVDV